VSKPSQDPVGDALVGCAFIGMFGAVGLFALLALSLMVAVVVHVWKDILR
jgi:hypothetical protein